jgi:two-component system, cell cycle sensor histidine kinase and response regulator CckA
MARANKNDETSTIEAFYRALFEHNLLGFFVTTEDGHFVDCNDALVRILGYSSRTELLSKKVSEFYLQTEERQGHLAVLREEGAIRNQIFARKRKDGGVVWCLGNTSWMPNPAGGPAMIQGTLLDITSHKKAEDALKELEARYRELVERIPAVAYISGFGPASQWTYVSPQIERLLGYTQDEWLAQPGLWLERIHPDDRARALNIDSQIERVGGRFQIEYRMTTREGRLMWVRDAGSVFEDGSGKPRRINGILTDITEQTEAAMALRHSEEQLRLALQAAKMGAWSWDAQTQLSVWEENAHQLFGLKPGEYDGSLESLLRLIHPDDRESVAGAIRSTIESRTPYHSEFRIIRSDGQVRRMVDHGQSTFDESGRIVRVHGVIQDVTDVHELQEQLRLAQRMEAIGQLAGGVAHDFNNLLTVIRAHADLLFERAAKDPVVMTDAAAIHKAADRAAAITQQLLAFSRKQVLRPHIFDPSRVVQQMSEMLRRLIGSNIVLHTENPPEPLWIRADEGQLEQVVLNLVINARDAMPEGGHVTLKTQRAGPDSPELKLHSDVPSGHYAHLSVRDTGTGMDAATRARIFEPFFTTKEPGKGTGLGLATVYGIVKQTGGWIWVDSVPGQGTAFHIFFPIVEASAVAGEYAAPRPTNVKGTETVLFVDDQDELRQVAVNFLRSCGYQVLEAADGLSALNLASQHSGPIDALITDVVMPGLGGPVLVERLRAGRPNVKVIYISGYSGDPGVLIGAVSRGVPFLQKPFQLASLARTLRDVLG